MDFAGGASDDCRHNGDALALNINNLRGSFRGRQPFAGERLDGGDAAVEN
jgi:hypothetical protein